jgi:hypothetical protein
MNSHEPILVVVRLSETLLNVLNNILSSNEIRVPGMRDAEDSTFHI